VLSIPGAQALGTATSTGRLLLAVIGAVGQAKREAVLERQREGSPGPRVRAATRGVCLPHGDRRPRNRLRQQVVSP
jgi:hypothetical protein